MSTLGLISLGLACFLLGGWCLGPLYRAQKNLLDEKERRLNEREQALLRQLARLEKLVADAIAEKTKASLPSLSGPEPSQPFPRPEPSQPFPKG